MVNRDELDIEGALVGLDMVHSELWKMEKDLGPTGGAARIISPMEIRALLLIVTAVINTLRVEE